MSGSSRSSSHSLSKSDHSRISPGQLGGQSLPTHQAPPLSLLSARRPSWTPSPHDAPSSLRTTEIPSGSHVAHSNLRHETIPEPYSVEDGGNFRQSLQIDMKGLVGDAVGNVRCSVSFRSAELINYICYIDEYQPYQSRYCSCCVGIFRYGRQPFYLIITYSPQTKGPLHHRPESTSGSTPVPSTRWNVGCSRCPVESSSCAG